MNSNGIPGVAKIGKPHHFLADLSVNILQAKTLKLGACSDFVTLYQTVQLCINNRYLWFRTNLKYSVVVVVKVGVGGNYDIIFFKVILERT